MPKRRKTKRAKVSQNEATSSTADSSIAAPEYGSPEWAAADEVIKNYQSSLNEIRAGREKVGYALNNQWSDWHNNLMAICFTLGGALIAVAPALHISILINQILFWVGVSLLILDGLFILFLRKHHLERESSRSVSMGYEIEYYLLVMKNRVLDVLKGKPFKQDEYEEAKGKLLDTTLNDIDESYEETGRIDESMDIIVAVFVASFGLIALSAIRDKTILSYMATAELVAFIGLLIVFRKQSTKPKESISERNSWLAKIKPERNRQ